MNAYLTKIRKIGGNGGRAHLAKSVQTVGARAVPALPLCDKHFAGHQPISSHSLPIGSGLPTDYRAIGYRRLSQSPANSTQVTPMDGIDATLGDYAGLTPSRSTAWQ